MDISAIFITLSIDRANVMGRNAMIYRLDYDNARSSEKFPV